MIINTDDVLNWFVDKTKDIPGKVIDGAEKAYTITEGKLRAIKNEYLDKETKIKTLDSALDRACNYICEHGCPCYTPCEDMIKQDKNCKDCLKEKFINDVKKNEVESKTTETEP